MRPPSRPRQCLALAPGATAQAPPAGGYQEDDGLGFRNIVPPGSDGVASIGEIFTFLGDGIKPAHNNDQLDEYDDLEGRFDRLDQMSSPPAGRFRAAV